MLTNILSLIHNATTLLFGVYASAAFLGVRLNRKNNLHLLIFPVSQALFTHFLSVLWNIIYRTGISFDHPYPIGAFSNTLL